MTLLCEKIIVLKSIEKLKPDAICQNLLRKAVTQKSTVLLVVVVMMVMMHQRKLYAVYVQF
jgi:hypothetical protein